MSEIADLLDYIPIEEVLEKQGVDYRTTTGSSGEQLNLRECPFCGGDDWKVYMNRESGLGSCFHGSCQERWNAWKFLNKLLGCRSGHDLAARLKDIARELGWRPARSACAVVEAAPDWEFPESVALPTEKGAMPVYLTERGVSPEMARDLELRWCAKGWFSFVKADGSNGGQPYVNRFLIPVRDIDGKLTTFQGRDVTGTAEKKYLFPPGLPGSGALLYNAQRERGKSALILVEGVMDVVGALAAARARAMPAGVIGSFGKHLSAAQIDTLALMRREGLKTLTVMWDGERAAYENAVKTAVRVSALGLETFVAALPAGFDPGDAGPQRIVDAFAARAKVTQASALRMRIMNPYAV